MVDRLRELLSASLILGLTIPACSNAEGVGDTSRPSPALSTPSARESDIASPKSASGEPALEIEIHEIAQDATTPLNDYRTDGREIIFSSGAAEGGPDAFYSPDLYRFTPDQPEPELVFNNPDRDSNLLPVAVDDGRYAFVEINPRMYGPNGWGIWYLSGPNLEPVLVDQSEPEAAIPSPIPILAMEGDRLVWTAFHQTDEGMRSQLLLRDLVTGKTEILLSDDPVSGRQYWFPSLDGDLVVYGAVDYSVGTEPIPGYVYLIDLSEPERSPTRLDTSGRAFTPSISGSKIVWKEAANTFDWGSLVYYNLSTGTEHPVRISSQPALNYPAVGRRFVAAWGRDVANFSVFDLETMREVNVAALPSSSTGGNVRPVAGGDLLVWAGFEDGGDSLRLRWSVLPAPSG